MTSLTERPLPGDYDAELAVVGGLLADPRRIAEAAAIVAPVDFFDDDAAIVFDVMVRMHQCGRPIDPPLLVVELTAAARGDEHAARRLREVALDAARTGGCAVFAAHHAAVVAGHAVRRGVIALCAEIAERVDRHEPAAEIIDDAVERLSALGDRAAALRLSAPLPIDRARMERVAAAAKEDADQMHGVCLPEQTPAPPATPRADRGAEPPLPLVTITRHKRPRR